MARLICVASVLLFLSACVSEPTATSQHSESNLQLPQLALPVMTDYWDPKAGYEAQIPQGWRRVVLDEPGDNRFSVSFESPPSSEADRFADYLLIEVIPGRAIAGFEQTPDESAEMIVDGDTVFRERHLLENYPVADTQIDLVAWQIGLNRPGYTVFMYAVGESREDARLERILIEFAHSFVLKNAPFKVS